MLGPVDEFQVALDGNYGTEDMEMDVVRRQALLGQAAGLEIRHHVLFSLCRQKSKSFIFRGCKGSTVREAAKKVKTCLKRKAEDVATTSLKR